MDGKGFFLGVLAAVVLFLLWKKESGGCGGSCHKSAAPRVSPVVGPGVGCGASCGSPTGAAAPASQGSNAGMISPGTPPLQSSYGIGSFYSDSGPTGDLTFTNYPAAAGGVPASASAATPGYGNTPGSPTTPANQVPVRAQQPVGTYKEIGFQQRYNLAGIPRTALN